jgi:ectoine hydroxylase-related dioxygenase (phytanoyl-CoA dioxygenase family)
MSAVDFIDYHQRMLPDLLAGGRAALLRGQQLPVLGLSLAGAPESFSYRLEQGELHIDPGSAGAEIAVELAPEDWRGLLSDLESVPGILYGGRLRSHRGDLMQFMRWEPVLRALYTGRPIYQPGAFELRSADGARLDPAATFSLGDSAGQMREFLDAAGYLLVKAVFTTAEIDAMRSAADEVAAGARQGDQQSWWGRDATGNAVLCRCLNGGTHPVLEPLYDDARIQQLAALLPAGMRHSPPREQDSITVVRKNPGVTEGLSDLPWHRDCGMGGHATMCPTYVFSLYLYDATAAAGCLQFLPGSHRYAFGFADAGDLPGAVTVPAQAGDVTVHIGDVMHAAPPPTADTGTFRQSILLAFHPKFDNHRGERHYNDVLLGDEQGQVTHLRDRVKAP